MSTDNRLSPRLEILGYVPGEITVLAPIAIRDLGPKGVQVESSFPLLLNSVHELRLHLAGDNLVVRGRVAHCRVADIGADVAVYRAGVEFLDVPPHVARAIEAHMERLERLRHPD
jgi:hypothetical protein